MKRLTTRGRATAEAIRDRVPFTTGGALKATQHVKGESIGHDHYLTHLPQKYWTSVEKAAYVVWSYDTPIAWVHHNGHVVIPNVKYTVTTTMHQGNLYLMHRTHPA